MNQSHDKLRVVFAFPGAREVIGINVNREIGTGCNPNSKHSYECDPGFELALAQVEGLILTSIWTRTEKHSFTTEIALAYDRDAVCLDIALAIMDYYGESDIDIEIYDNRIPASVSL